MKFWTWILAGLLTVGMMGQELPSVEACDACNTFICKHDLGWEDDVLIARGGRGGGGFSGGRSGGRSGGWGSSSKSSPSKSSPSKGWGSSNKSSRPSTTKPATKTETAKSKADRKAYETAKSNGKAFPTKQAAITNFKSKAKSDPKTQAALAKDYPTKYTSEPAKRPEHIPQTYNGRTVIYQNGGYGYAGDNGAFTMLTTYMLMDTMSDAMLISSMQRQGYHVGPAPSAQYTTVAATGSSGWAVFWWIVGILAVIGVIIFLIALFNGAFD